MNNSIDLVVWVATVCLIYSQCATAETHWNDNQRKLNVLILTIPASGHTSIPLALGEELVRRGHHVTLPMPGNKYQGAAESVGITYKSSGPYKNFTNIGQSYQTHGGIGKGLEMFQQLREALGIEIDNYLKMFQEEKKLGTKWDVVLATEFLNAFLPCVGELFQIPAILLHCTVQNFPHTYPPWPWASIPVGGNTDDLTFLQRFVNFVDRIVTPYVMSYLFKSPLNNTVKEFCPALAHMDLIAASSIHIPAIVPTVIGMEYPRTITPLTEYVGPILTESPEPCSKELENWLNSKKVIYISMGSLISVKKQMAEALVEGIKKTNYSVVWAMRKTDDFELDVDPERFFISDWLPQLSVLRHRATGIAILHGGANGVHESLHSGVPIILLPSVEEQIANAGRVHHHRLGIHLNRDTFTADQITQSIREIDSGDYQENVHKLQKMFAQAGGAKKAADLVEFYAEVGYDHLIPAYAKYQWTWIQYYNADVYTLLLACALITVYFWFRVMKCVWSRCCASKKQKAD